MSETSIPLATRLWFAFACFARVLFDASFAARAWSVRVALPSAAERQPETPPALTPPPARVDTSALQLLAALQSAGRLLDFLEEDVAAFPDAELGAAARVVHAGCRRSVRQHVRLVPVREDAEGARVEVPVGYDATATKLTGNVRGSGPWTGVLRHRGWRAAEITLPTMLPGLDVSVLAPAEVEL